MGNKKSEHAESTKFPQFYFRISRKFSRHCPSVWNQEEVPLQPDIQRDDLGADFSNSSKREKPTMKNLNPLERDIEKSVCSYAKSLGMLVYKFTSPSRRSVPDRMFITKTGVVFFIEFKRKGEKPTAAQEVEIGKIRKTEIQVFVIDDVEKGKRVLKIVAEGVVNNDLKLDEY
jgi:hypothetical protein